MLDYLFSAIYRGPLLAGSAICITSAIIGVILFYQKKLLLGETVSHAIYPAILIGGLLKSCCYSYLFSLIAGLGIFYLCEQLTYKRASAVDSIYCKLLSSFLDWAF